MGLERLCRCRSCFRKYPLRCGAWPTDRVLGLIQLLPDDATRDVSGEEPGTWPGSHRLPGSVADPHRPEDRSAPRGMANHAPAEETVAVVAGNWSAVPVGRCCYGAQRQPARNRRTKSESAMAPVSAVPTATEVLSACRGG